MRYEALARENAQLRGLRTALPPVAEKWLVAEMVHADDRQSAAARADQSRHQPTACSRDRPCWMTSGILGQTTHVGPWSAEVILITDPEHAIPVQIERTGVRTIAVGTGNEGALGLPYLPAQCGCQGGGPARHLRHGRRVPARVIRSAKVTAKCNREAVQPLAQVSRGAAGSASIAIGK